MLDGLTDDPVDPDAPILAFYKDRLKGDIFAVTERRYDHEIRWVGYWFWVEADPPYSRHGGGLFHYGPESITHWFGVNPGQCRVSDPRHRRAMWHPIGATT